jgi:hypothetical protein
LVQASNGLRQAAFSTSGSLNLTPASACCVFDILSEFETVATSSSETSGYLQPLLKLHMQTLLKLQQQNNLETVATCSSETSGSLQLLLKLHMQIWLKLQQQNNLESVATCFSETSGSLQPLLKLHMQTWLKLQQQNKTNSVAFSPRANYTD